MPTTPATIAIHKYVYDGVPYHVAFVDGVASTAQSTWFDALAVGVAIGVQKGLRVDAEISNLLKTAYGRALAEVLMQAVREILARGDQILAEVFHQVDPSVPTSPYMPDGMVGACIIPGKPAFIFTEVGVPDERLFPDMDAVLKAAHELLSGGPSSLAPDRRSRRT